MCWGARLFRFFLGAGEIGLTGGGVSVAYSSTSVDVNYVVLSLSAAYEAVLLGVGPFGDGFRDGVVDSRGDGLIVGVFEAERPHLFTLLMVSSSAVPFGRKIPRELLKPFGGLVPSIIVLIALYKAVEPVAPEASQAA